MAEVKIGHPPPIGDAIINDVHGLLLIVEKQPTGTTLDVTRNVEAALQGMKPGLKDVQLDSTIFRPATFVEMAMANLGKALLFSAVLVTSPPVNGEIVGIDPGSGIMQITETAIMEYDLDYTLVSGSSAAMTASLKKAVDDEEAIVVTLWSPHWAFNRWDLKYLEDPQGLYGEADHVETLARLGLEEDMPNLYGILTRFQWTHEDIQSVMMDIENGAAPEAAAATWIENNPEKVNEWIGEE